MMVVAIVSAFGITNWSRCQWTCFDKSQEVVATALVNADRYYRVMAPGRPEEAAHAFKNVAQAWLAQRKSSSRLSGFLLAGQVGRR